MDSSTIRSLETAGVFPNGGRHFKGVNASASSNRTMRRAQAKRDRQGAKRILAEMNRELQRIADQRGVRLRDFPKPLGRSPILGDLLDWLDVEPCIDESGITRFHAKG